VLSAPLGSDSLAHAEAVPERKELAAAVRRLYRRSARLAIAPAVLVALALLSLAVDGPAVGLSMLLYVPIAVWVLYWLVPNGQAKAITRRPTWPPGRQTWDVTRDGLVIDGGTMTARYGWETITEVSDWPKGLAIFTGRSCLLFIPERAFGPGGRAAFAAALDAARGYVASDVSG
jgi:uncharacterized RDD family membrane protein YckC